MYNFTGRQFHANEVWHLATLRAGLDIASFSGAKMAIRSFASAPVCQAPTYRHELWGPTNGSL
jgi:hypothetical protein